MKGLHLRIAGLAVVAMAATVAHAQQSSPIGSGGWIIGGSAGLSRAHDDATDQTATAVRLAPTGLYFVQPRLAFGTSVALGYSSTSLGTSTVYGLGPTARYYFGDLSGQLFPFLSATVTPQWQKSHRKAPSTSPLPGPVDATTRFLGLDGSAGLTRLVATHVGITGEAYYTHFRTTFEAGSTNTSHESSDAGLRFGLTVFVR